MRGSWIALALLAWPGTVMAEQGQGTPDDPIVVGELPFFGRSDTTDAVSDEIDLYNCATDLDQSGPERIFQFDLPADARVTAWVEGDDGIVDIDVHLLVDLEIVDGVAQSCVGRANTLVEADLGAGTHYAVVDTYAGDAQAGPFVLRMYAVGEAWSEIPVGEGVVWRARRFNDADGDQVLNVLDIDFQAQGVDLEVYDPSGCQTVTASAEGAPVRPVAAVNSSFFAFDGVCTSTTFMKQAGTVLAAGGGEALGFTEAGMPMVASVSGSWPEAFTAQAGRGLLVEDGIPTQGDAAWGAQGLSSGFIAAHPRTLAGYRDDGTVVLGTVDGRHTNAAGKSLDALATYAADELGCFGAVNWDGGGSTTMWVADMTPNGVVNYPSDAGAETSDHSGSRANGGAVLVHAPPYNWPPRFQTDPVTDTAVGESYAYDADAIDLNIDDVVEFAIVQGPEGLTVDPETGQITFTPTVESPPAATVTLLASDGRGGETEQTWELIIEGGMGNGGTTGGDSDSGGSDTGEAETGGAPGSGTTSDGPTGATEAGTDTDDSVGQAGGADGCSCRSDGSKPSSVALLLLLGLAWRRRPC